MTDHDGDDLDLLLGTNSLDLGFTEREEQELVSIFWSVEDSVDDLDELVFALVVEAEDRLRAKATPCSNYVLQWLDEERTRRIADSW